MPGSRAPERVHMAIPSMGVKPIVVSTLFPPIVAANEHPPPRWQIINRKRRIVLAFEESGGLAGGPAKAGPVKAIAANPFFQPVIRAGVSRGCLSERTMKACIKDGDLRNF